MIEYLGILIFLFFWVVVLFRYKKQEKSQNYQGVLLVKAILLLIYTSFIVFIAPSSPTVFCVPMELEPISASQLAPDCFDHLLESSGSESIYSVYEVCKRVLGCWIFLRRRQHTVDSIYGVSEGVDRIVLHKQGEPEPLEAALGLIDGAAGYGIAREEAENTVRKTVFSIATKLQQDGHLEGGPIPPWDSSAFLSAILPRLDDPLCDLAVTGDRLELAFGDHSKRQRISFNEEESREVIDSLDDFITLFP